METIRLCRFIRNVAACVVIAGMLTDFKAAVGYGMVAYLMTLVVSQLTIEGFFVAADHEKRKEGRDGQKPDGKMGGGDVPEAGS